MPLDDYGVLVRMAQIWFKRFQSGNFDISDAPCSSWSITEKVDEIMKKIEQNRHINSHHIVKELNIDHKTVLKPFEESSVQK